MASLDSNIKLSLVLVKHSFQELLPRHSRDECQSHQDRDRPRPAIFIPVVAGRLENRRLEPN